MKTLLLILALLPSIASAQFPPTDPAELARIAAEAAAREQARQTANGLVKSLNNAVATINPGNPATINAQQLVTFGVQRPIGTNAIRCVIRLTLDQRIFLGIPNAAATIAVPADLYAVMQVAGPAVVPDQRMPDWMAELVQTCGTPFTLTVASPSVILAARTNPVAQAAATGFACACRQATGTCNWTPPLIGGGFGAAVAAPFGMTIPAGLWSGAGCLLKSCVELYGFESNPPECPLN